jgi:hypothetical protein
MLVVSRKIGETILIGDKRTFVRGQEAEQPLHLIAVTGCDPGS